MTDDPTSWRSIEDGLLELRMAGKARVFERTRVEPAAVTATDFSTALSRATRRVVRWVPVAAAIGMITIVGISLFGSRGDAIAREGCIGILGCHRGPVQVVSSDACAAYDFDGDGDVDLVDISIFAQDCNRAARAVH
ncbi:MAG: hypothetical protein ACE5HE_08205 [Phycisphaerae bacterium]